MLLGELQRGSSGDGAVPCDEDVFRAIGADGRREASVVESDDVSDLEGERPSTTLDGGSLWISDLENDLPRTTVDGDSLCTSNLEEE